MEKIKKIYYNIIKILPLILIILIISLLYYVYLNEYLYQLYQGNELISNFLFFKKSPKRAVVYLYISSILLGIVLICMLRVIFTNPGQIPKDWHEQKLNVLINEFLLNNTKEGNGGIFHNLINADTLKKVTVNDKEFSDFVTKKNIRFCKKCNVIKPERAHHCRQCDTCILKMDHHCNWIYNCIGIRNYKFFLLMIFYLEILLIFITFTFTEGFLISFFSNEFNGLKFFIVSLSYMVSIIFLSLISFLFGFHFFRLSNRNQTTIEFCESKNKTEIYNIGIWNNFVQVFGYNPLLWMLPISYNPKNSGLKYETHNSDFITLSTVFNN